MIERDDAAPPALSPADIAAQLLDESASAPDLDRLCVGLYQSLVRASGFDPSDESALRPAQLQSGVALAPALAAQCVLDSGRTAAFLRGIIAAIRAARRNFPAGALEVVYAGTGPLAPLVIPLMPLLDEVDIRFTLIDLNRRSVNSVRRLLEATGRTRFKVQVLECDAVTYRHDRPIHVVISETLRAALQVEPFVAIVSNLRGQLAPGGLVVPEQVTVEAVLIDAAEEQAYWSGAARPGDDRRLGTIIEVMAGAAVPALNDVGRSAPLTITVPELPDGRVQWLALSTAVRVFDRFAVPLRGSGLTTPVILWPFSPVRAGDVIELNFEGGSTPAIVSRRLFGDARRV